MAHVSPSRRFRSSSAPIRPSPLSIPSGPLSPALPLTPPASKSSRSRTASVRSSSLAESTPPLSPSSSASSITSSNESSPFPPPDNPLPWLWTCHLCDSTYSLSVTRRCLHDGHVFCSGTTRSKVTGQIKRHRSCASEFDYVGWGEWMYWRRASCPELTATPSTRETKRCWTHCDYPSQCRWGHKMTPSKDGGLEERVKIEVEPGELGPKPADHLTDFDGVTTEIIVEQVVEAVKRTVKRNSKKGRGNDRGLNLLSSICEEGDDAMDSPKSPLRQHYTLPMIDDLETDQPSGDTPAFSPMGFESPADNDDLNLAEHRSTFSSSSEDSSIDLSDDCSSITSCGVNDRRELDLYAGIASSRSRSYTSFEDSPPLPDWADTDSDYESITSDSTPELDLGIWDPRAGYFPIAPFASSCMIHKGGTGRRIFGIGRGMTPMTKAHDLNIDVDAAREKFLEDGMTV